MLTRRVFPPDYMQWDLRLVDYMLEKRTDCDFDFKSIAATTSIAASPGSGNAGPKPTSGTSSGPGNSKSSGMSDRRLGQGHAVSALGLSLILGFVLA